jgi:hypothetical protein
MDPKRGDVIGAALLAAILVALIVLLVAGNIPAA